MGTRGGFNPGALDGQLNTFFQFIYLAAYRERYPAVYLRYVYFARYILLCQGGQSHGAT